MRDTDQFAAPRECQCLGCAPLRLVLRVDLPLRVVTNVANFGKASDVELSCTELRHDGD